MEAKTNRPNPRNRNKNKNKKRFSAKSAAGQSIRPTDKQKQKPKSNKAKPGQSRSGAKRRFNRSRSNEKLSPIDKLIRKYEHFMDMYLGARKKYFSLFFTAEKAQKVKLHKSYKSTMGQLREFESNIPEELRDEFDTYLGVKSCDTSISEKMESEGQDTKPQENTEVIDPHKLPTQGEKSFKDDAEESVATKEDFDVYAKMAQT